MVIQFALFGCTGRVILHFVLHNDTKINADSMHFHISLQDLKYQLIGHWLLISHLPITLGKLNVQVLFIVIVT